MKPIETLKKKKELTSRRSPTGFSTTNSNQQRSLSRRRLGSAFARQDEYKTPRVAHNASCSIGILFGDISAVSSSPCGLVGFGSTWQSYRSSDFVQHNLHWNSRNTYCCRHNDIPPEERGVSRKAISIPHILPNTPKHIYVVRHHKFYAPPCGHPTPCWEQFGYR